jgi:hypothetical protein
VVVQITPSSCQILNPSANPYHRPDFKPLPFPFVCRWLHPIQPSVQNQSPDTPSQTWTKAPVLNRVPTMAVPSVLSTKPVRVFVIVSSTLCLFVFWSAILSSMWTFESELVKDGGESAEQSDQVCHVLVISTYPPRRLVVNPVFYGSLFSCKEHAWFSAGL